MKSILYTLNIKGALRKRKVLVYLCGTKDDSVIVLSSTGSFFLLPTKTNGHWTEAVVYAEEILVFCDDSVVTKIQL